MDRPHSFPNLRASRRILEATSQRAEALAAAGVGDGSTALGRGSRPLAAGEGGTTAHQALGRGSRPLIPAINEIGDTPNLNTISKMAIGRASMGTTGEDGRMQYR